MGDKGDQGSRIIARKEKDEGARKNRMKEKNPRERQDKKGTKKGYTALATVRCQGGMAYAISSTSHTFHLAYAIPSTTYIACSLLQCAIPIYVTALPVLARAISCKTMSWEVSLIAGDTGDPAP